MTEDPGLVAVGIAEALGRHSLGDVTCLLFGGPEPVDAREVILAACQLLWDVHHAPPEGPPLVYYDQQLTEWELADDPLWEPPWWKHHQVRVELDTRTDYRANDGAGDGDGAGVGDLHAWLIAQLRQWLTAKGIHKWAWEDEQAHIWHDPNDSLHPSATPPSAP